MLDFGVIHACEWRLRNPIRPFSYKFQGIFNASVFSELGEHTESKMIIFTSGPLDVTKTGNGERGTRNGEPGPGVWERVYSGNPLENSTWRTYKKKRQQFGEM